MEATASIRPALLEHTAGFGRMCTTPASGEGYKFVKWAENGQTVSESASYTFTVSGDRALTAVFEEEKTSRLPAGYTEVEYIQGAGNVVPASAPHI